MAGSQEVHGNFKWFNCSNRGGYNEPALPNSFIRCDEHSILFGGYRNNRYNAQKDINLFDRVFDAGSAIHQTKLLFRMARKEFKILEYSLRWSIDDRGYKSNNDLNEEECKQLRKHLCELFHYIRIYFLSLPLEMKLQSDRIKVDLLPELSSFLRCLPPMTTYADFYVILPGRKTSCSLYHMLHLNLDIHWYYISLLLILKNYADSLSDQDEPNTGFVLESKRVKETGLLEKQVQVLITDLLALALAKFEKVKTGDLYEENPFICSCVKELWLLLQILCDSLSDSGMGKSFWIHVNSLLDRVVPNPPVLLNESNFTEVSTLEALHCSDPAAFSLWIILHLSHIYGFDTKGEFVGRKSGRVKNNYSQLEKIISSFVNQNSQLGNESQLEHRLRQYIYMASELCLERWWEPMRGESIMIFWEYFHRRLNVSLLLPGTSPATLPVLRKSAIGLLLQVKERLSGEGRSICEDDSFCMFMKFLGVYLIRCRKEETSLEGSSFRQWQQMRGRIYSKIGPSKVKGLSHIGLYRLISLFLTLSVAADVKEVGKKMLDMLGLHRPWDPTGRDMSKRELAWQAYMCLLCLHIEHEIDIAQAAEPLIEDVKEACNKLAVISKSNSNSMFSESWKIDSNNSEGLRHLLSLFTEGMNEIIDSSPKMALSEYTLIGPWIPQWLQLCSPSSSRKLMDTLLAIVDKLHTLRSRILPRSNQLDDLWGDIDDIEMADGEETSLLKEQWNKMESALLINVLPLVRSLCLGSNPPFQVADLAVSFTLSAFNGSGENFGQLFSYFAASDTVNYRISRRYLCHLVSNEEFMKALPLQLSDYQDIIIQAWVRSSLLSFEESSITELEELTRIVSKLKKVSHLLSSQTNSSNSNVSSFDSFAQLLKIIGERYDMYQTMCERSAFRETCSVFFCKVDKIIGPPVRALSSQEIIMSIYHSCGLMVFYCGKLIYTKGKPNCLLPSILSQLILPHVIYNRDAKLHKFILAAIKRSIYKYACGLAQLSPASDSYIQRCLRDVVTQYIPRLYEKAHSCHHPLLGSFEESSTQNEILQNTVLEILTTVFLTFREKQCHVHALKALDLLHQILEITRRKTKINKKSQEMLKVIAYRSLPSLLDFLLGVSEETQEWRMSLQLINAIVLSLKGISALRSSNERNDVVDDTLRTHVGDIFGGNSSNCEERSNQSEVWKEVLSSVTQKFCQRHMAFSASSLFRVMQHLLCCNPDIVKVAFSHLQAEAKNVELRRGVGYDPQLRSCLQKIQSSLEAATETKPFNVN